MEPFPDQIQKEELLRVKTMKVEGARALRSPWWISVVLGTSLVLVEGFLFLPVKVTNRFTLVRRNVQVSSSSCFSH